MICALFSAHFGQRSQTTSLASYFGMHAGIHSYLSPATLSPCWNSLLTIQSLQLPCRIYHAGGRCPSGNKASYIFSKFQTPEIRWCVWLLVFQTIQSDFPAFGPPAYLSNSQYSMVPERCQSQRPMLISIQLCSQP